MGGARVPVADSTNNRLDVEVVGNKSDAAVTTVGTTGSLMAYVKGILGGGVAGGSVADAAVYVKGTAATDTQVAMLKGLLDMVSGTAGVPTFPAAAAPANAVSLAEVLRQVYDQTGIGSEFWLKKTLTSSAIPQAGVDVTGVSAGGELAIEDVVVKTDATGLAAMTNFELETNNAKGLADFFVTIASGLGANKTVELTGATVTKIKTVLESGAKVIARASAADGTGAGTIDVYIKFRRLAAAATVSAA